MYRGSDLWEDAYRVAQTHGGPNAAKVSVHFTVKLFNKIVDSKECLLKDFRD